MENQVLSNVAKLRGQWVRFRGDTHNLTFGQYVALRFRTNEASLRRIRIKPYGTIRNWLRIARGV
jgi:hypothetical protein